ncbi:MAG: carbonic anhydrase [Planctomycetes bacterium]|nr:carbonic anhydrase [Planctomycetota bacterium]
MKKLIEGVRRFQANVTDEQLSQFREMTKGQAPESLFITCSDSRVVPGLFTQSGPGDLFEIQNAGNIVPPYGVQSGCGVAATVEYAVTVLGVAQIVVCGHSHCGAMGALFSQEKLKDTSIPAWLSYAEPTRRVIMQRVGPDADPSSPEVVRMAVEANVLAQLDNLRTHPSVAVALDAGRLQLHAWVYQFESAEVFAFDSKTGAFESISEPAQ